MTVLLTGVTGLVGARLLPRLLQAGLDCRALVRAGKRVPSGAETVEGDLFDAASLTRAVTGITAVIHLAAVFRTGDADLIWRSNLEGTRSLIAAVRDHAPKARFILASTSNVYDPAAPGPGARTTQSARNSPTRQARLRPKQRCVRAVSHRRSCGSHSSTATATGIWRRYRGMPSQPDGIQLTG